MFGLLVSACSTLPEIPAKGQSMGEDFTTTVDSEAARYYLEDFRAGKNTNPALHAQMVGLRQRLGERLVTREELKQLAEEYSVDFASLFLADQLLREPCNRLLNADFARELTSPTGFPANASRYIVLFVPGWDYAANGHLTGADLKEPRRLATEAGFENHLVELPPTGSVEENARYLGDEIARRSRSGKPIILAGASSAGPAIHLALSEMVGPDANVKAWLNLGGILQGSPLVDYLYRWPQRWLLAAVAWFKGWRDEAIQSMATAPSRARFQRLKIQVPDLLIINYVGIPLSGQLTKFSSDKYPLLKAEGPNDGLTLVTDVIAPDSLTIVALGSDHFFAEDPRINLKTVALMKLMTEYLERQDERACPVRSSRAATARRL